MTDLEQPQTEKGRWALLRVILQQHQAAFDKHVGESEEFRASVAELKEIMRELGPVEQIRKRGELLDRMIAKEEQAATREKLKALVLEKFLGKYAEAAATQLGKYTPPLLLALVALVAVGWDRLAELARGF